MTKYREILRLKSLGDVYKRQEIKWDAEAAEKGGFEHFMMKEIHEQPKAVQDLSLIHILSVQYWIFLGFIKELKISSMLQYVEALLKSLAQCLFLCL